MFERTWAVAVALAVMGELGWVPVGSAAAPAVGPAVEKAPAAAKDPAGRTGTNVGPDIDPDALLRKRSPAFPLPGSFGGYASFLYATMDVWVYTDDDAIAKARFTSPFPSFYHPTFGELFDAIGRQTGSSWSWDAKLRQFKFTKGAAPAGFKLKLADGWRTEDRGEYVWHAPAEQPFGLDVYALGTFTPGQDQEDKDGAKLFARVREAHALRFATPLRKDARVEDMKTVRVGGTDALYFECPTPRPGGVWRQWALVKDGKAFVIVSAMPKEREATLLPAVQAMVASFEVTEQPTRRGDEAASPPR